jgi:amidase
VPAGARLDEGQALGTVRGPLHGIPVLMKDKIATRDEMQTTAGSLQPVDSRVPAHAVVVSRLRRAGAVILGKAYLSEWAYFRGPGPIDFNGWSARGGKARDPCLLSLDTFLQLGGFSKPSIAYPYDPGTLVPVCLLFPGRFNLVLKKKSREKFLLL